MLVGVIFIKGTNDTLQLPREVFVKYLPAAMLPPTVLKESRYPKAKIKPKTQVV